MPYFLAVAERSNSLRVKCSLRLRVLSLRVWRCNEGLGLRDFASEINFFILYKIFSTRNIKVRGER